MMTSILKTHAPETLTIMWDYLNDWRRKANLRPYSFGFLADIARSADAIPGEPVDLSKSTIYAVMRGTYTSATADAIQQRLADCIQTKIDDMRVAFPSSAPENAYMDQAQAATITAKPVAPKPSRPRRKTPAIHRRRCSHQGYITHRGHTYYLGSTYAGQVCTISLLKDRSKGIRATTTIASRTAYPVDPANNQLGYEAGK